LMTFSLGRANPVLISLLKSNLLTGRQIISCRLYLD
jgi:hypothetical protein